MKFKILKNYSILRSSIGNEGQDAKKKGVFWGRKAIVTGCTGCTGYLTYFTWGGTSGKTCTTCTTCTEGVKK